MIPQQKINTSLFLHNLAFYHCTYSRCSNCFHIHTGFLGSILIVGKFTDVSYQPSLSKQASTCSTSFSFPNLEVVSHLICVFFGCVWVLLCVISKARDFLLLACSSDLTITWTLSTLCGKPDQSEKYQVKSKLCGRFVRTVITTMHLWLMLSTCLVRYIPQRWVCESLWISLFLSTTDYRIIL